MGRRTVTHCKRGHPLQGDNLYITPSTGSRLCRTCRGRPPGNAPKGRSRRGRPQLGEMPPLVSKTGIVEVDPQGPIAPEPPFRPAILDEWPVTLCRELPMDWTQRAPAEEPVDG